MGTGAGKVLHGLTLTHEDTEVRKKAISFVKEMKLKFMTVNVKLKADLLESRKLMENMLVMNVSTQVINCLT